MERLANKVRLRTGTNVLLWRVPVTLPATGSLVSRFRVTRYGIPTPDRPAPDGEVEDHLIEVGPTRGSGAVRVSVVGGELIVRGDSADNFVVITVQPNGTLVVQGNGTTVGGRARQVQINQPVSRVRVALGGGADVLIVSAATGQRSALPPATISLGTGADFVSVADVSVAGTLSIDPGLGPDCTLVSNTVVRGGLELVEPRRDRQPDRLVLTRVHQRRGGGARPDPVTVQLGGGASELAVATARLLGPVQLRMADGADMIRLIDTVLASQLELLTFGGSDRILFDRVTLHGRSLLALGEDDDELTIDDTRALAELAVAAGGGSDQVQIERRVSRPRRSRFEDRVTVSLDEGDDELLIGQAGVFGASADFLAELVADGGPGTDRYDGPRAAGTDSNGNTAVRPPQVANFEL